MKQKYLNTLELPKIQQTLTTYTNFSAGAALAEALLPTTSYREAVILQEETSQARHLLSVKPNIGVGSARDVRPLTRHAQRSIALNPEGLLEIRQTMVSARELERQLRKVADDYPRLDDWAVRLDVPVGLINLIGDAIDDSGRVKDQASPALARIRREIDVAHGRLMDKIRRISASGDVSKYLQEDFITQRDGRYVIPIKSDHKGKVRGVIHDQSSSGATLFVEPFAVVELNNTWRQLQMAEQHEVDRILAELTAGVAQFSDDINHVVDILAELDLIFAKAKYADAINAYPVELQHWDDHQPRRIHLRGARHPLLNPQTVVPIDLELSPDTSMLVITGPNTGGKTVSLKTVGLLAVMAQCGLHIPTKDGSQLMVFDAVFADIGDEQSLEQSLSTFSAHMTNIVTILGACTPQSLVIFDELGAGTDPAEGSALARAILKDLLLFKITTLVATHYAELKAFAYTTASVANASMKFDLASLSPTYQLEIGLPGNSNAFAIARRLGLNDNILRKAETMVDKDAHEAEVMLTKIRSDQDEIHYLRLRLEEELAETEYNRRQSETKLSAADKTRQEMLEKAAKEAEEMVNETGKEIKRLEKEARKALVMAKKAINDRRERRLRAAERKLNAAGTETETLTEKVTAAAKPAMTPKPAAGSARIKIGKRVQIPHLGSEGIITDIQGDDVEVQLGHFRTTVKRSAIAAGQEETPAETVAPKRSSVSVQAAESNTNNGQLNLDLRGQNSEDAQANLDSFLDQSYLAGMPFVRIIHGKGTGVLRRAVREALQGHPLVASFKAETDKDGGSGVTVAKLAIS